jgi:hypothetical protein
MVIRDTYRRLAVAENRSTVRKTARRTSVSITEDVQATLQYGKDVVVATARGGLNAIPAKGSRLQCSPRTVALGAGVGAALGVCGVAITERRKSPLALLAGGLIGGALAAGIVMAWEHRTLAGQILEGCVDGSRPVRDAHWLADNPIDYA